MNIRRMSDDEIFIVAGADKEFLDFLERHRMEADLDIQNYVLAYKIWYHARHYKPDPLNPTRLKDSE